MEIQSLAKRSSRTFLEPTTGEDKIIVQYEVSPDGLRPVRLPLSHLNTALYHWQV